METVAGIFQNFDDKNSFYSGDYDDDIKQHLDYKIVNNFTG